jgi:hypothetical protein
MLSNLQPRSTEEILTQWNQEYIIDIKIIDKDEDCQNAFKIS